MNDELLPPYHIDGIQFGANFGPVSIQYSKPDDVGPVVQEFRQLNVPAGASEEIVELVADIMDSICQLIDLAGVIGRSPDPQVRPRR